LPAHDIARTRTADEPVHPPIGANDGAIAKVRADRGAPDDDGCNRIRFLW
jgi:hypothetical protein